MSERKATELVIALSVENRISTRCASISQAEIFACEPVLVPEEGEFVVGTLDENLIKWYVGTQLEYDHLQEVLYGLNESDEKELDRLSLEAAGILKAQFLFVMAVRGFFSKDFPENIRKPFQVKKGWTVVCVENR